MKAIAFDQIKTMLKSMSLSIFNRMGKLENKLDPPDKPIKHIYATDENGNAGWNSAAEMLGNVKPIIITRMYDENEPYYMCNFTVDGIWDLDADVIQQNTRVIDGDNQYAVRGVNKTVEMLYGNVIQFTVDLNAPYYDLTPPFTSIVLTLMSNRGTYMFSEQTQALQKNIDATKPFQRNDCIHIPTNNGTGWAVSRLLGVKEKIGDYSVPVILNVVSSDYLALSSNYTRQEIPTYNIDIDRISVVQAAKNGALSDVVLCYTDSHEASVGKVTTLDRLEISGATNTYADVTFIMKPDENGKYARITLDEKNAGKAIVEWAQSDTIGNKKVGEGLKIVGDALTVDEGEYELIEKIIVGYELLTAKPADWETNWKAYYKNTGTAREPVYTLLTDASAPTWAANLYYNYTGESATLRRHYPDDETYRFKALKVDFTTSGITGDGGFSYFRHNNSIIGEMWHSKKTTTSTQYAMDELTIDNGYWKTRWTTWNNTGDTHPLEYSNYRQFQYPITKYPYINRIDINQTLAAKTTIEIWGVRA